MYLTHFGLRGPPFGLTPDTSFFLNRAGYQNALNVLLIALRNGEGFVKVSGEVGTGKTLLCRQLINTLEERFITAYIYNPYLTPAALLRAIAGELLVKLPGGIERHQMLKCIEGALLRFHAEGKRVVVCLDESQAMPVETLETLRLLTNLETEKRKLLQVVLFGQPELDALLAAPSVRQLRQRITFSYSLLPMSRIEADIYVAHRLRVAGYQGARIFSREALKVLYLGSRGIPRLINILCNKAMMLAYGGGKHTVTQTDMEAAMHDTLDAQRMDSRRFLLGRLMLPRWLYSALGLVAMFAFGAVWGGIA